jgi:hypothetical protein
VARLQVEALHDNDATDAGIVAVFAFASPTHQRQTSPLARLNERQVVTITTAAGGERRFFGVVSRDSDGACAGGWLTDAVITLETSDSGNPVWPTRSPT